MNKHSLKSKKIAGLVSAIGGSLIIGLPAIPRATFATPNPCPGIFYIEPFNRTHLAPQGCPPNAATRQLGVEAIPDRIVLPPAMTPNMPPLPAVRSDAIARVRLMNEKVDVKLKNNTNALVSYEAIGHTQRRFLRGQEEIVLRDLPTPVTITTVRQDRGLLDVIPVSTSPSGLLEISLDESTKLDDNLGAMRIQKDGQVFLN